MRFELGHSRTMSAIVRAISTAFHTNTRGIGLFLPGFTMRNFLPVHHCSLLALLSPLFVSFGRASRFVSHKLISRNEWRKRDFHIWVCFLAINRVDMRQWLVRAFYWATAEQFTQVYLRQASLSNGTLDNSRAFRANLIRQEFLSFRANSLLYFLFLFRLTRKERPLGLRLSTLKESSAKPAIFKYACFFAG